MQKIREMIKKGTPNENMSVFAKKASLRFNIIMHWEGDTIRVWKLHCAQKSQGASDQA